MTLLQIVGFAVCMQFSVIALAYDHCETAAAILTQTEMSGQWKKDMTHENIKKTYMKYYEFTCQRPFDTESNTVPIQRSR